MCKRLFCKILGWGSVLGDTFEVLDSVLGVLFLLINYAFELVELAIALFYYFLFKTFLV